LESSRRDLHNALLCTVPNAQFFVQKSLVLWLVGGLGPVPASFGTYVLCEPEEGSWFLLYVQEPSGSGFFGLFTYVHSWGFGCVASNMRAAIMRSDTGSTISISKSWGLQDNTLEHTDKDNPIYAICWLNSYTNRETHSRTRCQVVNHTDIKLH